MFENRQTGFGRLSHSPFQYWTITFCLNQSSISAADLSLAAALADCCTVLSSSVLVSCASASAATSRDGGRALTVHSVSSSSSLPSYKSNKHQLSMKLYQNVITCSFSTAIFLVVQLAQKNYNQFQQYFSIREKIIGTSLLWQLVPLQDYLQLHPVWKKGAILLLLLSLPNVNWFSKFFHPQT